MAGIILDKTKRFEEIAKICFGLSAISGIFLTIMQLYTNDQATNYYLLLLVFILIGIFGLPLLPICMEMAVECVYPIPEATSTGILFMSGQVVGILMIVIYPKTAIKLEPSSYEYEFVQTCLSKNGTNSSTTTTKSGLFTTSAFLLSTSTSSSNLNVLDFKYQMYFQSAFQVTAAIIFIAFFKCAYLRLRSEKEKMAEKILNSARL